MISRSGAKVASLLTNIGWIVIIPILGVFFLKDKHDFRVSLQNLVSDPTKREFLSRMIVDVDTMLSQFVRAQLLLAVISGIVYTFGLSLLGVPYAFVLGAVGGLLEFIPLAGPAAAAVGILGICFGLSYPHILWVVALPRCVAGGAGLRDLARGCSAAKSNCTPCYHLRNPSRR